MSKQGRNRRQQLLQEAEGYLELIAVFDDRWPLDDDLRTSMADRCLSCLSEIEDQRGRRAQILYLEGQAYRSSNRFEQAIPLLEDSYRLDSLNIHTCLALGWCYKRLKQYADAVDALERALAVDEQSAIVHYNLACYLALCKNTERAVQHLASAFELNASYRNLVGQEKDFDPIRNDPDFLAVTSVIV